MVHEDKDFGERVARLGFPLLQREPKMETNETLAEVVQSGDPRLWEGFPVMLANSVERHQFDYRHVRNYLAHSTDGPSKLDCLLALSLALYQVLNVNGQEFRNLRNSLGALTLAWESFVEAFKSNGELNACGHPMSADRLKTTFQNYYLYGRPHGKETEKRVRHLGDLLSTKRSYDLEYSLSQLFTPKQKELVLKKFRGEKLTKTEKEYYSRTIRKKLSAMANEDLHQLAAMLL
jgi:hypothetical protein